MTVFNPLMPSGYKKVTQTQTNLQQKGLCWTKRSRLKNNNICKNRTLYKEHNENKEYAEQQK